MIKELVEGAQRNKKPPCQDSTAQAPRKCQLDALPRHGQVKRSPFCGPNEEGEGSGRKGLHLASRMEQTNRQESVQAIVEGRSPQTRAVQDPNHCWVLIARD